MPTSESQKRANTKWRLNNKDRFNMITNKAIKKWRKEHKDEYAKKNNIYVMKYTEKWKEYYAETQRLRKILFDGFIPVD